ncbi:MAG: DUF4406 domain-containing protein [Bacteroidetes bacterium]|nr:DUF4406 domain-containing protein [Bacteroidota bacterium]
MIKVYIASPYTLGDTASNVKLQMDTTEELFSKGFAPFTPLYYHFQQIAHPRPEQHWIKIGLEWIKVCDAVLRLPGKSKGADGEVAFAGTLNIPVFYSVEELCAHYGV